MTDPLSHPLRSDAQDNRARILDAARELLAAQGLAVPMREIARHAGVGPATLYRHFPTKEALAVEAFAEQMTACAVIAEQGLAEPDPWRGFCLVVTRTFELHARDRGFTEAFLSTYPNAIDLPASREHTLKAIAELARRAKASGQLRQDFAVDDLILMIMANRGIHAASAPARIAASRRFAALAIQAFHATSASAPLPPLARLAPSWTGR